MLRINGRAKLVLKTIFKLMVSMLVACASVFGLLLVSYSPSYEVKINGETLGYVENKYIVQGKIEDYLQNGDKENVGYVILEDKPTYEFTLLKKNIEVNDDAVVAKVIEMCDVYYRVYGINVNSDERFVVETIKEAQELVNKIEADQDEFSTKAKIEISEKFVQQYDLLSDTTVAVNDIVDEIEKENNKVVKKTVTYAASTGTVSPDILLALKESNVELDFRKPLDNGIITSRYGIRSLGNHKGLDVAAKIGTPIHVAESGVVTYAGWMNGYGYLVKVQHASGYETYYGHCNSFNSKVGDEVVKGDVIAFVGNTGRSTGPHVHFEVRINGSTYDPLLFIEE